MVVNDGGLKELIPWIGKESSVFHNLKPVWSTSALSRINKLHLYSTLVLSIHLENTANIVHKLNVFHQSCLRKILGISWHQNLTNEEVHLVSQQPLQDIITEHNEIHRIHPLEASNPASQGHHGLGAS